VLLWFVAIALRSIAVETGYPKVVLFAGSTLAHGNNVIKLDLIVLEELTASLTLIIVPANHTEHNSPRNMATNSAEFLSFRKRLVDEEHWAHMPKDTAALLYV